MSDEGGEGKGEAKTSAGEATAAVQALTDDARNAAAGIRDVVKWIAAALAGIPALAALGSLIRAPGEAGFEPLPLGIGIGLAAAGAILGILSLANVLAPVAVSDGSMADFDMRQVPGQPYSTYYEVIDTLDILRKAAATEGFSVADAKHDAESDKARAADLEQQAKVAEAAAKDSKDPAVIDRAKVARTAADSAQREATESAAHLAALAVGASTLSDQIHRWERVRAEAFQLKAAKVVGDRFDIAKVRVGAAAALVAAGVFFLALAPAIKLDPFEPTLVTLTLNNTGRTAIGCEISTLTGIQVNESESGPLVITFPSDDCPSKSIEFKTDESLGYGDLKEVDTVPSE